MRVGTSVGSADRESNFPFITRDVCDLQGKVVLKAKIDIRADWNPSGDGSSSSSLPAVTLCGPLTDSAVLSTCQLGHRGGGGGWLGGGKVDQVMHIYNSDNRIFGRLSRESGFGTSSRYVLSDASGNTFACFDGSCTDQTIVITDPYHDQMADTNAWTSAGALFWKIRVAALVDAGLILCGIMSFEMLEMQRKRRS